MRLDGLGNALIAKNIWKIHGYSYRNNLSKIFSTFASHFNEIKTLHR